MKFAWYDGAVLSIPGSSVSLTVSHGSFDHEKVERMWVCEAVKRKLRPSSIFVDYLKCILVREQFGAFVVVANTGDHQSSQERNIDAQMAMKSNSQERVNATCSCSGGQFSQV